MMLNSGDGDDPAHPSSASAGAAAELGGGGFSEEERGRVDEGGRNSGGNRWPRQETLALLKIRSDMDVAFRDSSLKGPLWDEVSRKLAELGYHRSAKKCKEKFENVYKYHKRTKEGRTSKADGKTYRFFDQLQALEASPAAGGGGSHLQPPLSLPAPPPKPLAMVNTTTSSQIPSSQRGGSTSTVPVPVTVPSMVTPIVTTAAHQNNVDPISVAAPATAMPMNINHVGVGSFSFMSASTNSTSSSTSSDEEPPERRRNRKRKWKEFFGKLMKEVIDKQEELQSKFLETLEKRERDRMAREEAWRMQEMVKMKREHDLLVQERSMVAAKDAAVITFLQKITEQNPNAVIPQIPAMQLLQQQQPPPSQPQPPPSQPQPQPVPPPMQLHPPPPPPQSQQQTAPPPQNQTQTTMTIPVQLPVTLPLPVSASAPPQAAPRNVTDNGGGGENMLQPSPSRWPKAEINALIKLRTTLDTKYQESGPKGPLWEEISSAMRKLGYNRNAKRCKEKWENINKYYKKVKESSKKRPEDSKTCPYFHQLDAIYREKATTSGGGAVKPDTQMAIMARPEQQWPLPAAVVQEHHPHHHHQQQQQIQDQQNADHEEDYDDEEDDEDEEEEGGEYEIVPNKTSSMAAVE